MQTSELTNAKDLCQCPCHRPDALPILFACGCEVFPGTYKDADGNWRRVQEAQDVDKA